MIVLCRDEQQLQDYMQLNSRPFYLAHFIGVIEADEVRVTKCRYAWPVYENRIPLNELFKLIKEDYSATSGEE